MADASPYDADLEQALAAAWAQSFGRAQEIPAEILREAVRKRSVMPIVESKWWRNLIAGTIERSDIEVERALYLGYSSGYTRLPDTRLMPGVDELAAANAGERAVQLAQNIEEDTRAGLQVLIGDAARSYARSPSLATLRQLTDDIRPQIGLTDKQAAMLARWRTAATAAGMDEATIASTLEERAATMIGLRAKAIGERGVIEAISDARHASWLLARDKGVIPKTAKKQWMTQNDAAVRATHLEQQNQGPIPLDEAYPIQGVDHPPSDDYGCRCWEDLVYDEGDLADEQQQATEQVAAQVEDILATTELSVADQALALREQFAGIEAATEEERIAAAARRDELYGEYADLGQKLYSGSGADDIYYAPEGIAIRQQREAMIAEIRTLNVRLQEIAESARSDALNALRSHDASFSPAVRFKTPDKVRAQRLSQALDWLRSVSTNPSAFLTWGAEAPTARELTLAADRGARSYASGGAIYMAKRSGVSIYVHEIGHWIEKNPTFLQRSVAFLESRTEGENARWIGKGYRRDEVAKFDKFTNPYAGKIYGAVDRYATEILSMGLQALYEDPIKFAREDPGFFDFIIGFLRGK